MNKYICEPCNYSTNRLYDYDKHLSRQKHKVLERHTISNTGDSGSNIEDCRTNIGAKYDYKSRKSLECEFLQSRTFNKKDISQAFKTMQGEKEV